MKVVSKQIDMICYFDDKGIHPLKFRTIEEGICQVIKINKVIKSDEEKYCGHRMVVFTCSAVVENIEKIFEIKYDIENMKWLLYKI